MKLELLICFIVVFVAVDFKTVRGKIDGKSVTRDENEKEEIIINGLKLPQNGQLKSLMNLTLNTTGKTGNEAFVADDHRNVRVKRSKPDPTTGKNHLNQSKNHESKSKKSAKTETKPKSKPGLQKQGSTPVASSKVEVNKKGSKNKPEAASTVKPKKSGSGPLDKLKSKSDKTAAKPKKPEKEKTTVPSKPNGKPLESTKKTDAKKVSKNEGKKKGLESKKKVEKPIIKKPKFNKLGAIMSNNTVANITQNSTSSKPPSTSGSTLTKLPSSTSRKIQTSTLSPLMLWLEQGTDTPQTTVTTSTTSQKPGAGGPRHTSSTIIVTAEPTTTGATVLTIKPMTSTGENQIGGSYGTQGPVTEANGATDEAAVTETTEPEEETTTEEPYVPGTTKAFKLVRRSTTTPVGGIKPTAQPAAVPGTRLVTNDLIKPVWTKAKTEYTGPSTTTVMWDPQGTLTTVAPGLTTTEPPAFSFATKTTWAGHTSVKPTICTCPPWCSCNNKTVTAF